MENERYLGDGVYASFDGYQIWLDLRAENPDIRIAMEPFVYERLRQFASQFYELAARTSKKGVE